jgi:hypothetical protein
MPISAPDLAQLAKVSLDDYMRNVVIDQIATERPFLKKLMEGRKLFLGAKQNIVVNIRTNYGSNFGWAYGEDPVIFNKRNTTDLASFPWRRAVDGLYLDYDRLFGAGIKVREGERGAYKLEQNEKVQLLNLLDEQMDALREGFMAKLDLELHRNGTADTDAIAGLDALVPINPAVGVIGGLDRATALYWRPYAETGIVSTTAGLLRARMELMWRRAIRNGGAPNFILAGGDFIDAYASSITLTYETNSGEPSKIDIATGSGSSTGVFYKGIEIIYDPQFKELDALETPVVPWEKRCYFLNMKHLKYRDDDMDVVTPVRPHDILALYAMINLRCALVLTSGNSQAVIAIA